MKKISKQLQDHLDSEVHTLATCWCVTRTDGVTFGFTDCDQDLSIGDITYCAATGFTRSAIRNSEDLSPNNLDIQGFFDDSALKEEDLKRGLYDRAKIDIFMVNYQDLSMGRLHLRSGSFGNVQLIGGRFVVEMRGITQGFERTIGDLYTPFCRAQLGDARCGVDLNKFQRFAIVKKIIDTQHLELKFEDMTAGCLDGGKILWKTGIFQGQEHEIKRFDAKSKILTLFLPLYGRLEVGDECQLFPGCNRSFESCSSIFKNAINFRGEPFVPGFDAMQKTLK